MLVPKWLEACGDWPECSTGFLGAMGITIGGTKLADSGLKHWRSAASWVWPGSDPPRPSCAYESRSLPGTGKENTYPAGRRQIQWFSCCRRPKDGTTLKACPGAS